MKTEKIVKPETLGMIISNFVPSDFLLGSKLGRWYDANPYHKFNEGDILVLRSRNIFGYGVRPVAFVEGFSLGKGSITGRQEGMYHILMHTDFSGDYFKFVADNIVPEGIGRFAEKQRHFKWNIENQFRKVDCTVDEALAMYASKEVKPELIFPGQQNLQLSNR